jgi:hypothetical protein
MNTPDINGHGCPQAPKRGTRGSTIGVEIVYGLPEKKNGRGALLRI